MLNAAGWGAYLSYGLPATIQLCTEWWMYEVVIFMAGGPGWRENVPGD